MERYLLRIVTGICFFTVGITFSSANADDLIKVYREALRNDPIFAQAKSTWESQKMNLPIAEAGYLPQVSVTGNASRNYDLSNPPLTSFGPYSWQYGFSLSLSQPIFNLVVWSQIKGSDASVKAATATYLEAQQSLMQRTVTGYFSVLQAYDQLHYTIANRRAVWEQYVVSHEQYKAGIIAITNEYDARLNYDQVVAQQIAAQNNLNNQLENLRALTGHAYTALKELDGHLILSRPKPSDVNQWVKACAQQNYSLKAQNYTVLSAMEAIKQADAGADPQLSVQGSDAETHTADNPFLTAQQTQSLGLSLSYKPIQGGLVLASTQQARYNYATASGLLEQTYRQVVDQARSGFFNVFSDITRVKADKLSIVAAKDAVDAREAGLKVGTRTMIDLLAAYSSLYQAQQQLAADQYTYINNLISLKLAAGTLNLDDLEKINSMLGKSVHFPKQIDVAVMPTDKYDADITIGDYGDRNEQKKPPEEETIKNTMPNEVPIIKHEYTPVCTSLDCKVEPKPGQFWRNFL